MNIFHSHTNRLHTRGYGLVTYLKTMYSIWLILSMSICATHTDARACLHISTHSFSRSISHQALIYVSIYKYQQQFFIHTSIYLYSIWNMWIIFTYTSTQQQVAQRISRIFALYKTKTVQNANSNRRISLPKMCKQAKQTNEIWKKSNACDKVSFP